LLTIGEDRYLSTLILRTFPEYDTVYVPAAVCTTSVPESLSVLMDQRRRWTNSLIHCHVDHMIHPPKFPTSRQTFFFFTVIFLELWMVFMLPELIACGFFFLFISLARGMSTLSIVLTCIFLCIPLFVATFTGRWRQYFYWFTFFCGIPVFSIAIPVWSLWQLDNVRRVFIC
jgi:cellulose synthase/poly-beta-1,6-N-acetylglucosamine synthase-like glycosyltransferase